MADKNSAVSTTVSELPSHQPQLTTQHLTSCVQQFRELSPKISKFVYDNGQEYKMICLTGTIPMPYKGSTYNIPVNIWIHADYPSQAPIVLVTPTKDMQIKPSKIVDNNGRVYLPYLHEWKPSQGYDLVSLVNILCMEFSSAPPLFARSSAAPPRPKPTYTQQPPPSSSSRPPYNQYPAYNSTPAATTANPPIGWNLSNQQEPQQPPAQQAPQHSAGFGKDTLEREDTQAIIKSSMVSKIEHDLQQRYKIFVDRYEAEMNALYQQDQELQAGTEQIAEILLKIEEEKEKIRETIELFKTKDGELRAFLSQHQRDSEENLVDQQIEPKAPLFKQYLNLYAEESALDDAIYYLAEALRNNVIEIQLFLKNVRALARKKFMVRALMNKVITEAGKCEIK